MKPHYLGGVLILTASLWPATPVVVQTFRSAMPVVERTFRSAVVVGQSTRPPDALRTQSLNVSDNLYLVSGGGGNSLMMTGDDGVTLVDVKLAGRGQSLAEIAASISEQPVTTAIYTHGHVDHTGGSRELVGLRRIIAHENTKAIMERMEAFKGAGARSLPGTTFQDKLSLGEGRDRIDLYYFGAGHTNGDIVVVFPGKRLAYLGDLFPGKSVPVIDAASGGSGVAWPQTLARVIAELKEITRIIPGHAVSPPGSPLGRWITIADLQEYAGFTRDFLIASQEAFKAGKTVEQAAAELKLSDRYAGYNLDNARASVQAIYDELKK